MSPTQEELVTAISRAEEVLADARAREDHRAMAEALRRLSEARLAQRAPDQALEQANEALRLFQDLGDSRAAEAEAQLCVCNAHLGRIALQADSLKFPARVDVMGALRAAKAGLKLYTELADEAGKARASKALSRALLASGVPASMAPKPQAIVETRDLAGLIDDLGGAASPFCEPALEVRTTSSVRSKAFPGNGPGKDFDRSNFRWRDPASEYCYSLIWEKYKGGDATSRTKKFNACAVAQGARSTALPLYHSLKAQDPADAVRDAAPLCVHINAYDASQNYGATLMAMTETIKSMLKANLRRLTFVQVGEGPPEALDSPNGLAARHVGLSPCILAMLRSARIEAPQLAIGFVSGDAASWMSDRQALVSAIFDTATQDQAKETELMWSRGEPMMPTLISKPLPGPKPYKSRAPHEAV